MLTTFILVNNTALCDEILHHKEQEVASLNGQASSSLPPRENIIVAI